MSSVNENISQNKIDIVTNVENNVTVNQPTTSVVTVTTQGPQGAVGPQGPQGEPGAAADLTAINAFTGSAQTNLNTLNDFTSSVILASQTASMTVATASFAISASHEIIKEVSSSYADTASISNLATNANNVYVDANVNSSTAFHLPMYQPTAGGSGYDDGYYQLKNPLNEVFYYSRGTNPITNLSNASDYLYIGGGTNTAGGIYFNSTVSTEPFLYSDFNRMYIKADDRFGANNASYPARLEISTYTGSFAATGVPNYISLESTEVRVTGSVGMTSDLTVNGNILLPDGGAGGPYIGLGDAQDLKIFHNGGHSIVRETGVGSLYLQSDNNVILSKDSNTELMVKGIADGAVELYYDNVKKFETTADGIYITGSVTASGNISASGYVKALTGSFGRLEGLSPITVGDSVTFDQPVTGSVFSGSFIGDGTSLTGVDAFPHTGDAQITGSLLISGSKIHLRGESRLPGPILELESIGGSSGKDVYVKVGDSNENYAYAFGADDSGNTFRISSGTYSGVTLGTNDKFIIDGNNIEFPAGNISGSATSTASFGTYIGDGSNLTGITSAAPGTLSGSAQIATEISGAFGAPSASFSTRVTTLEAGGGGGSGIFTDSNGFKETINNLIVSQSNTTASLSVIGSGSAIFNVEGSVGQLFEVQDGLDGVLMSVNDISGIPILTVSSSGNVIIPAGSTFFGTASHALNVPGATTAFPFTGDARIDGTLDVTGSGDNIFKVRSKSGSLFSVDDGLDGILMSVNDISGLPLFEISSSGDVEIVVGNISGSGASTASFGHLIVNGTVVTGGAGSSFTAAGISGSFNEASSSFSARVTSLEGGSGLTSGILSSSAQISTEISGAFGAPSSSFSTRITTNESNISSLTAATASLVAESLSIFRQEGSAAPGTGATQSIAVTVVSTGDGNKYALDGVITGSIVMNQGDAYKFDQSDSSNGSGGGHPFRVSTDTGGSSNYDVGVVIEGTPGSAGAYTQISVTSATTAPLYYYCSNHANMGLGGILSVDSGSLISTGVVNITGSLIVSSSNVDFLQATGVSGSFSGSFQGDGNGLTNISSTSLNGIGIGLSTIVGDGASSATSYGNAFGKSATSTGGSNVAIGAFSNVKQYGISIGHSVAGGNNTVAVGYNAGHTSGENNVLVGYQPGTNTSGDYNISLGYFAGYNQTSGTGNITIGSGSRGVAGESNQLRIGHGNGDTLIHGDFDSGSITFNVSGSDAFQVIGSEGTIFALDDDLDGTLFTVNDRSGIPQFEVSASGLVEVGNGPLIANTYETGSIANGSPSSPLQMTIPSGSSKQLYGVGGYYRASWDDGAADFVWFQDDYIKLSYDQSGVDIEGTIIKDAAGSNEIHISLDKDGTRSALDKQVSDGIFDLNATIGTDQTDRYIFAAPLDPTWPYYKIELTRTSAAHGSGFYAIVEKFI